MNAPLGAARAPGRGLRRGAAAACLTFAVLSLPALWVGSRIDAPPTAAELERLGDALAADGAGAVGTPLARAFAVATVWPQPPVMPPDDPSRAALTSRARLAQVAAIFAGTLLLYVIVLLARGRLQALLACASLLLLPPVALEGCVQRPEAAALVFVACAVLLLQCLAAPSRVRQRRGAAFRAAHAAAVAGCASLALGLAVGTQPSLGECLLVPGIVLVLAVLQLAARARTILRRSGLGRLPMRAINERLLPWTATTLLAPAAALWFLLRAGPAADTVRPSASGVGLLPDQPLLGAVLLALVALGTIAGIVRTGLRFGRGGRIGGDVVVLTFCGVHLAAALGDPAGVDRLPAAPALAVVLSEGLAEVLRRSFARWRPSR